MSEFQPHSWSEERSTNSIHLVQCTSSITAWCYPHHVLQLVFLGFKALCWLLQTYFCGQIVFVLFDYEKRLRTGLVLRMKSPESLKVLFLEHELFSCINSLSVHGHVKLGQDSTWSFSCLVYQRLEFWRNILHNYILTFLTLSLWLYSYTVQVKLWTHLI